VDSVKDQGVHRVPLFRHSHMIVVTSVMLRYNPYVDHPKPCWFPVDLIGFSGALSRQTTTNLGPHGRGIDYNGGWLPAKIRMDDQQWHKYELIKGTLDLAVTPDFSQPWPI